MSTTVIIVTYNSSKELPQCIKSLKEQSVKPHEVIIIDNASTDPRYLDSYKGFAHVILNQENLGFCAANNLGFKRANSYTKYILFLNPDAWISSDFLKTAEKYLDENPSTAAITGPMLSYDFSANCPTGKYDSTGIFSTWYGQWYDRGQNERIDSTKYQIKEEVPAICGALMFCRKAALEQVLLNGKNVFNPTFYMYKEDIDLSLRLKKHGSLDFIPYLLAFHGRGWKKRGEMTKQSRLLSARNEMKINAGKGLIAFLYSLSKFLAVKIFNI